MRWFLLLPITDEYSTSIGNVNFEVMVELMLKLPIQNKGQTFPSV